MQILVLVAEATTPRSGSCGREAIRPQQQPPIEIIHRQRIRAPSAQQASAQSSRSRRGGGCSLRQAAAPVAWERSPSGPRSRPRAATPSNGAAHGARLPRRPAGPNQGEPLLRTTMLRGTKRREQQQASAAAYLSVKCSPLVPHSGPHWATLAPPVALLATLQPL